MARKRVGYGGRLVGWIDAPADPISAYASVLDSWSVQGSTRVERPWSPEEAAGREADISADYARIPEQSFDRRSGTLPALAYIERVDGRVARCLVQVSGAELPVEIPFRLLGPRGLRAGMRFMWWMSKDGSVVAEDIDDVPPDRLTDSEEGEARQLYRELYEDIAARDDWSLNPGHGR